LRIARGNGSDHDGAKMIPRPSNRWPELGLILLGLLAFAAAFRACDKAYAFQSASPAKSNTAPAPPRSPPPDSTVGTLGRIEIPRLGISAIIAEGTDNATLKRAVGHLPSTAQPGQGGNVGLAAHRDGLFRGLGRVRKNDLIRVVTPGGSFGYRVAYGIVVGPHRVDLLDSTAVRSLTLITCYPFHWIGHAPKRFVVRAVQFEPLARGSRRSTDGPARRT
jgi:LPXTG-site transpeptidase (sortase) family protein